MEFDFDAWAKLAKDDPEAFERKRELTLRSAIDSAPSAYQQRLEGLQFRLNLERRRAPTPMAACVRMNLLMWSGFFRLRKELMQMSSSTPSGDPHSRQSAKVIPMHGGARSKREKPGAPA